MASSHVGVPPSLQLLSTENVRLLREQLGLGCVIDLRSTAELRKEGRGVLEAEAMRIHHLPLFDGERRDRGNAAGPSLSSPHAMPKLLANDLHNVG